MKQVYNITVPKLGDMTLTPTEKDHIYLTCDKATIRGVDWRFTCHFYRWADGKFHIGREQDSSYNQRDSLWSRKLNDPNHNFEQFTEAAKKAVEQPIIDAVNNWAANNAQASDDAEAEYLANAKENRMELIQKYTSAMAEIMKEVTRIEAGEHLLDSNTSIKV